MDFRINNLRTLLSDQSLDAALITSIPNIIYLTGYSGFQTEERDAYLLVTEEHLYLFTSLLYLEEVKTEVQQTYVIELSRGKPLTKSFKQLAEKYSLHTIGIEEHNLTAAEYKQLSSLPITLSAIDLEHLRINKDTEELAALRKACEIGDLAFQHMLPMIKPGVTEKQLAYELDLFMRQKTAAASFRPIVAFGKNAAIPHHLSNDDVLQPNSCVLMDFGVRWDNYCSDMTRTVFLGKASTIHKKVYQTVREAQEEAIKFIKTNIAKNEKFSGPEADNIARTYISDQGFEQFPHSLGHGIGLEIHESPSLSPAAKEAITHNMVFTIEPGIYILGEIGVRIEDDFVIQKNKLIQLTNAPKELIELPL